MKRFSEGFTFPTGKIHMASKVENNQLVIIPANEDWQLLFDFMIGW